MVPPTAGWNLPCQPPTKTILTDMATGQSDQGEFSVEIPSFLSCVKLEIKVNHGDLPLSILNIGRRFFRDNVKCI